MSFARSAWLTGAADGLVVLGAAALSACSSSITGGVTSTDTGWPTPSGTGRKRGAHLLRYREPTNGTACGTKCATSCAAPGITVCETNADWTTDAGSTCTASKADGNQFGFCN